MTVNSHAFKHINLRIKNETIIKKHHMMLLLSFRAHECRKYKIRFLPVYGTYNLKNRQYHTPWPPSPGTQWCVMYYVFVLWFLTVVEKKKKIHQVLYTKVWRLYPWMYPAEMLVRLMHATCRQMRYFLCTIFVYRYMLYCTFTLPPLTVAAVTFFQLWLFNRYRYSRKSHAFSGV